MKFLEDKKAKTKSFFLRQYLSKKNDIIKFIKKESKNYLNNTRISINSNSYNSLNYMMIFQKKNFIPIPKFYRKRDKIFSCEQGKQIFLFFDKQMNFKSCKKLSKNEFLFLKKNTIYTNISLTPKTIHSEILPGPYVKNSQSRVQIKLTDKKLSWIKNYLRHIR